MKRNKSGDGTLEFAKARKCPQFSSNNSWDRAIEEDFKIDKIFAYWWKTISASELFSFECFSIWTKKLWSQLTTWKICHCQSQVCKGTSIKDVPFFQGHLDPPTIPCPTLSHFHVPTQKRTSKFDNTPIPFFFYGYNDNICWLQFFLYNFFLNYYSQN